MNPFPSGGASGSGRGSEREPAGEFDLIERFRRRIGSNASRVSIGIGDDCAALRFPESAAPGAPELLVTTDMLMDGRHFDLRVHDPVAAGRKAMGVNLSDIAAMAGEPLAAVVSVALPRRGASELAEALMEGLWGMAREFGVELIGGDTNGWDGPLVISVTLFGQAGPRGPIRRSGARAGDRILVTGPLGGSLAGRHLEPRPRVAEAAALARGLPPSAMIDLSDGASSDLRHILKASGNLGATLDAASIPIHPDAEALARRDGRSALDHALHDGEDFELCLTAPAEAVARWRESGAGGAEAIEIGVVTEEPGVRMRLPDGRVVEVPRGGFDHLRSRAGGEPGSETESGSAHQ